MTSPDCGSEPAPSCPLCSRLVDFRVKNQGAYPDFHNAPVPAFSGGQPVRLLVVGLAPGLKGANRTGRPFTGDYAGDLLYPSLIEAGFASGNYDRRPDDGLRLQGCRITNAVRCVPPENKPTGVEIKACNGFLSHEITSLGDLKVLLALGRIAHDAVLTALGERKASHPFGHAAEHVLPGGLRLVDSYHCSRYNTSTKRLSETMFKAVIHRLAEICEA